MIKKNLYIFLILLPVMIFSNCTKKLLEEYNHNSWTTTAIKNGEPWEGFFAPILDKKKGDSIVIQIGRYDEYNELKEIFVIDHFKIDTSQHLSSKSNDPITKLTTDYFTMACTDVLGDKYIFSETDTSYFQVSLDKRRMKVFGTYHLVFVRDSSDSNFTLPGPDTIKFENGVFNAFLDER
ncbi:MAG: hypothetical protein U9N86_04990 [Bacteroidota bacterium]|nr:hypothetical protein [Bacteroidota bacterium]